MLTEIKRFALFSACLFLLVSHLAYAQRNKIDVGSPHVVFLISEDPLNYEAHVTVPAFAKKLGQEHGFRTSVLLGIGKQESYRFPGLEVLSDADLLVVFCRRLALKPEQLDVIKTYLQQGKPIIGLRTANHAFSLRQEVPKGYEDWWGFVPTVLGCENRGYEPEELGTDIEIMPDRHSHDLLKGITDGPWHSNGSVYKVAPLLDSEAVVLLTGSTANGSEPIAWTRKTASGSRAFYTSLGYPDDFKDPRFLTLLSNGVFWALSISRE